MTPRRDWSTGEWPDTAICPACNLVETPDGRACNTCQRALQQPHQPLPTSDPWKETP